MNFRMVPLQNPTRPKAKGGGRSVMSALRAGPKTLHGRVKDDKMNVILKTKLGYVGLGVVLFVWFLFNIKLKKCKPQWTQDLPSLVTHNKSTTS